MHDIDYMRDRDGTIPVCHVGALRRLAELDPWYSANRWIWDAIDDVFEPGHVLTVRPGSGLVVTVWICRRLDGKGQQFAITIPEAIWQDVSYVHGRLGDITLVCSGARDAPYDPGL